MNKEMLEFSEKVEISEKKLATRMDTIADMYTMAIFYNKLKPAHSWECGCLIITPYTLDGTFYKSTGIFFAEDLVAIVAENDTMYEYVNLLDECDEIKAKIRSDLDDFIKTGLGPDRIVRYPKIDE